MIDTFQAIFDRVRSTFAQHAAKGVILHDEPGRYYLGTHEVRAKDGYRTWLGGVEIKKNYVSVHLISVHAHPELLDDLSPGLRRRMQGKSCFNFKKAEAPLLEELDALVARSVALFEADGQLSG